MPPVTNTNVETKGSPLWSHLDKISSNRIESIRDYESPEIIDESNIHDIFLAQMTENKNTSTLTEYESSGYLTIIGKPKTGIWASPLNINKEEGTLSACQTKENNKIKTSMRNR